MIEKDNDVTVNVAFEAIIRSNKEELLKGLLSEYGENRNQETFGSFILMAANIGSPESVNIILNEMERFGISSNLTKVTNRQGNTSFHEAAISGSKYSEDIMELLISLESQLLEIENEDLRTPLHLAAYGNS